MRISDDGMKTAKGKVAKCKDIKLAVRVEITNESIPYHKKSNVETLVLISYVIVRSLN